MDPQVPILDQIPNDKSQITNGSHNITVISMAVFVLLSLSAVGFLYYQNQQLKKMLANYQVAPTPTSSATALATADPTANWKTYTHPTYKYQFKYPSDWSAVVSQSASANTLFGLNADSKSGIGGIEVREIPTEPQNFNSLTESKIIKQTPVTINGISGYKTKYSNVVSGTNFVFRHKDGLIYNIYINSEGQNDLEIFDQILSTFKFINPVASPSAKPIACTKEAKLCPDGSYVGRTGPNCEFAPCP